MACYISSNQNRYYVASESTAGQVANAQEASRIAAVNLKMRQSTIAPTRLDKTGTRTFLGLPRGLRRLTDMKMRTYFSGWSNAPERPAAGPLFESVMGSTGVVFGGVSVASSSGTTITTSGAHGLSVGQGVTFGGEIRFVIGLPAVDSVVLNAPFSVQPTSLNQTVNYAPGDGIKALSVFDYWSPASAVHRIATGVVIDQCRISLNGDYHEFEFRGPAMDLIDSASFTAGEGGMAEFPGEPAVALQDLAPIPGHLGQVWLGATATRFATITEAEVVVKNNIDVRDKEFGSAIPRCVSAGMRNVGLSFALHEQDSDATKGLYQAARSQSPISVMLQMGQQSGQLFGVFLRSVVPSMPEFEDSGTRLQWRFDECAAQGVANDEIFVAFG